MKRAVVSCVVALLAVACSSEPGGGGVNIEPAPTTTGLASDNTPPPTTTVPESTTTVEQTTTTMPATTTTKATVVVTGAVLDPRGDPVAGATVAMGDQEVVTGPDGSFTIDAGVPGDMVVTKHGWSSAAIEWREGSLRHEATIELARVRGLRVSPDAAASETHFSSLLTLADNTAVNALVFDTKQEGGLVLYESGVPEARSSGAVRPVYDPVPLIAEAHARGLYTITRIVAFDDSYRVGAFPGDKLAGGWVNPEASSARRYLIDLAVEACELGFDEIQFDYIRYPSGSTATITGQLEMSQAERVGVIAGFLAEARSALLPRGCPVSAAIFGIVASVANDQGLGQRPEEVSAEIDVLSPMVYPSHYSPGWLGLEDPNAHPYRVTAEAIEAALPRMGEGSQLRPYLQAFWWSNEQIRESIQAAEDQGVGWILWNVRSNFDPEALPGDEEVHASG